MEETKALVAGMLKECEAISQLQKRTNAFLQWNIKIINAVLEFRFGRRLDRWTFDRVATQEYVGGEKYLITFVYTWHIVWQWR